MTLDRLYRWLLCCYPAEFRLEYREEMLLLYHERSQAEPRLALWIDIVADLFRTAPKEHLHMIWSDLLYAFRALRKAPLRASAGRGTFWWLDNSRSRPRWSPAPVCSR